MKYAAWRQYWRQYEKAGVRLCPVAVEYNRTLVGAIRFAYSVSEEWSAARLERAQRIIRTGIASVDRCPAGIQHDEPAYRLNVGCVWLRAEVSFFALSLSLVGS